MTQTIKQLMKAFIGLLVLLSSPLWIIPYLAYSLGIEAYKLTFGDKYND